MKLISAFATVLLLASSTVEAALCSANTYPTGVTKGSRFELKTLNNNLQAVATGFIEVVDGCNVKFVNANFQGIPVST